MTTVHLLYVQASCPTPATWTLSLSSRAIPAPAPIVEKGSQHLGTEGGHGRTDLNTVGKVKRPKFEALGASDPYSSTA
jgi:hypothetical protein